jgi:uncharacterized protein YgbK (DUF1537 family)
LLGRLPDPWPKDPLPEIRQHLAAEGRKVIVLDDDPTGTQTIHGLPVLTRWSPATLAKELTAPGPAFYLLTNSRSLPRASAAALNRKIGQEIAAAAHRTGRRFAVISRSDSTLRGHFPSEVDALADAIGGRFDARMIIPFFEEGGRYTVDDIHYLARDEMMQPVGLSEFARDPDFEYQSSNLKDWISERTGGQVASSTVASISIEDLRTGGPGTVAEKLMAMRDGRYCVVNAACYRDLEVFAQGLLSAESRGRRFLYRTAASFVRVRTGTSPRQLLSARELDCTDGGGLIIVGSYVPTTTTQLDELMNRIDVNSVEIDVGKVLDQAGRGKELERVRSITRKTLSRGEDTVIYTSRRTATGSDSKSHLKIGRRISEGIVSIVRGIRARPRCIIAKGGITSSVVATEGLGVERAMVRGQIMPGIPVWQLGDESLFPDMTYVVFPGNVGGPSALADVFEKLMRRERLPDPPASLP